MFISSGESDAFLLTMENKISCVVAHLMEFAAPVCGVWLMKRRGKKPLGRSIPGHFRMEMISHPPLFFLGTLLGGFAFASSIMALTSSMVRSATVFWFSLGILKFRRPCFI